MNKKTDEKIYKRIKSDLQLNANLATTFGTGIGAFYPIVESLMKGSNIEIDRKTTILITICAITIIYSELKKGTNLESKLVEDSKTLLTELKLRGVGNGFIKKIKKSFIYLFDVFKKITTPFNVVVSSFIDMFAYTSLMIPIMNTVYYVVGKYDMGLDNLIENFIGVSIGVGTITTKHAIMDMINKLKLKFPNKKDKLDKVEIPNTSDYVKKFDEFGDDVKPLNDGI